MKEAVLMDRKDNVATLLQRVEGGQEVAVIKSNRTVIKNIIVTEDIPFGHKAAVEYIGPGEAVKKYGQVIGTAVREIKPGEHVHIHNVRSTVEVQLMK